MAKTGKKKETTINNLAGMVARGFGRVDERFEQVDKKIESVRSDIKGDIVELLSDIDIMLSRHIGTFRRDYDDLAARVKKLEEKIFH